MYEAYSGKLTTGNQITIPSPVRKILGLRPGDSVVFEIDENSKVFIRKAPSIDVEFLQALEGTLTEWLSKNDEDAYRNL